MPTHASNRVHGMLIDMQVFKAYGFPSHKQAQDLTQDDLPRRPTSSVV